MRVSLREHLISTPAPSFYSVSVTKSSAASYLRQYRQHQWLAASRGLISKPIPQTTDVPTQDEYVEGRLEEDNELVVARLQKTQSSLQTTLRQIDADLARLQNKLLSTRRLVWVRTGLIALFIGVFLNIVTSIKRVHTAILSDIPRSLRPYIPLIPSPIAIIYIVAREWQISAVAATRARLEGLRVAVASSHSVSSEEISWLDSKKWEGVDFSRIGL